MIKAIKENKENLAGLRPVLLLLLDGWGLAPISSANAINLDLCPNLSRLVSEYPVAALQTTFKNPALSYLSLGSGRPAFSLEASYEQVETLPQIISAGGLRQAYIAESEKFALATYFFKGKNSQVLSGEDQFIVSSIAGDYSSQPELALKELSALAVKKIKSGVYDFILLNLSNLDLLSSTGSFEAITKSLPLLDKNIDKLVKVVLDAGGVMLITSAHGNAEKILDLKTDLVDIEITDNPVPFLVIGERFKGKTIGRQDVLSNDLSLLEPYGSLNDVAPTIIKIMNLSKPEGMTGQSLI